MSVSKVVVVENSVGVVNMVLLRSSTDTVVFVGLFVVPLVLVDGVFTDVADVSFEYISWIVVLGDVIESSPMVSPSSSVSVREIPPGSGVTSVAPSVVALTECVYQWRSNRKRRWDTHGQNRHGKCITTFFFPCEARENKLSHFVPWLTGKKGPFLAVEVWLYQPCLWDCQRPCLSGEMQSTSQTKESEDDARKDLCIQTFSIDDLWASSFNRNAWTGKYHLSSRIMFAVLFD